MILGNHNQVSESIYNVYVHTDVMKLLYNDTHLVSFD